MSKLLRQNVGNTDFSMVGCTLTGVCNSAASDYIKSVTLTDGDEVTDGMTVVVTFANGNTAGTAPASMTIYSSDQVNYYADDQLTVPFTLAPAGCYEIEYTGTGNAYSYISYPVMQVGSVSGPLCDASGNKSSGALWLAEDKVSINYSNGCFNVIPQTTGFLTVTAASGTVNGAPVRIGSTVRVLFTQDLTGAANTGLVLTYNGVGIPVMVGKNGSLGALLPFDVGGGTYKYLQAYTTLEMMYDGTQFIVLGNPVVISNSDYTVYTDGSITYFDGSFQNLTLIINAFAGGSVKYSRRGNFVRLVFNRLVASAEIAESSSVIVGILPEEYRPSNEYNLNISGVVEGTNSGQRQLYTVTIDKDGTVTIYNDYGNLNRTIFYATGMIEYPIL